jgi:transcriptional regulator with XRE-family HTH domain
MSEAIDGFYFRGQVVRNYRIGLNWTIKKLAAHLGIAVDRVSKIERGSNNCSRALCEDAMKVLEVPEKYFDLPMRPPPGWNKRRNRSSSQKVKRMNRMWESNQRLGATKEPRYPVYLQIPISIADELMEDDLSMSLPAHVLTAVVAVVEARRFAKQRSIENEPNKLQGQPETGPEEEG